MAAAACVLLAACGGGSDEAAETPPATDLEAPATAEPVAEPAPAAPPPDARGLTRVTTAEATRPPTVAPVAFERLLALLPTAESWERREPTGEAHATPVPYASAQALYWRDDQSIRLEIVDSGFQPLLLTPHEMFMTDGYDERTSEGFIRARSLGGAPAYARWNAARQRGEIVAIVNGRFIVSATGVGVPSIDTIDALVSRVDVGTIGRLR